MFTNLLNVHKPMRFSELKFFRCPHSGHNSEQKVQKQFFSNTYVNVLHFRFNNDARATLGTSIKPKSIDSRS